MSFLSSIFSGATSGVFDGVGELAKDMRQVITGEPDPDKKLQYMEKYMENQLKWGIQEARSASVFVSGWRPFIGWVCGVGLAYIFLIHPIFLWLNGIFWRLPAPPALNSELIWPLISGMLGLGGIRSFDKRNGKG